MSEKLNAAPAPPSTLERQRSRQASMLETQLGYFPAPFEGETVYSVCARIHRLVGRQPAMTSRLLQIAGAHAHPAAPIGLDFIESASCGVIPATEETLRTRTLLRAFLPLMPMERRKSLLQACTLSGSAATALARAGLNRYRHSVGLLRFCPACAETDKSIHAVSFWHVEQQLPGTWICEVHHQPLCYMLQEGRRRGWWLPSSLAGEPRKIATTASSELKLLGLQQVIGWIAARRTIDLKALKLMLRMRVRQAGLCRSELKWTASEGVHIQKLAFHFCSDLKMPDVSAATSNRGWFELLFREQRRYDPLPWGLALSWLGSTTPEALETDYIDALSRNSPPDLFDSLSRTNRNHTAPAAVYAAFRDADLKRDALTKSGLSEFEIDGWLRRDRQLRPYWKLHQRERRRREAEYELRAYLLSRPRARRVDVLKSRTAAYRWLQENERDLLDGLLPAPVQHLATQLAFSFERCDADPVLGWPTPPQS